MGYSLFSFSIGGTHLIDDACSYSMAGNATLSNDWRYIFWLLSLLTRKHIAKNHLMINNR